MQHFLTNDKFYVSIGALVGVWSVSRVLGSAVRFEDALVVTLVTAGVYQWNRLTDSAEDQINSPHDAQIAAESQRSITLVSLIAFALSLLIPILSGNLFALAFAVVGILLGVLYNQSFGRLRRFKNITLVKNVISSLGWALGVVVFPTLDSNYPPDAAFVFAIFFIFINIFTSGMLWDIRDFEGDREAQVNSLPTVIGIEKTKWVVHVINLGTAIIVAVGLFEGQVSVVWALTFTNNIIIYLWIHYIAGRSPHERLWSYALVGVQFGLLLVAGMLANLLRHMGIFS